MELKNAKALVIGGTGMLGQGIARGLADAGASVVVTGRDPDRTAELASALGTDPLTVDMVDVDGVRAAVRDGADALGGLDVLVVATGVPAFGAALETSEVIAEELFAVNTLGPMAAVREAGGRLSEGGSVVVLSAIIADSPTNHMAEYSAAKAALTAWLKVVRRENRRAFSVLDVRPPHLDTGLADHPLSGEPPKLPEGLAGKVVVDKVLEGIATGESAIVWDPKAKELAFAKE